jgi:putative ABC transport system ATP-binding protein
MGRITTPFLIDVRELHKTYTRGDIEVRALRGVSLQVMKGEFIAIMGTSGSGKSTFMNTLGCLDRPTKGIYLLDGEEVHKMNNDDRAELRNKVLGFVFQGFNLLSRTSALENVELPMMYRGVSGRDRKDRAMKALEAVGLAKRFDHTPAQLSGGQQQRVAIARALAGDPSVILADEPTGNLDSRTSIEVMAILQKLCRDQGITIVLVTHEQDIAQHAHRIVTFRDGLIVSDEAVKEPINAEKELASLPAEAQA